MDDKSAPALTTEEQVKALRNWAVEMGVWGKQVRADIVRLEQAVGAAHPESASLFRTKAKLVDGPAPWEQQGDPGDPPTPPT